MSLTKHSCAIGRVASGNHCSSQNDEPEPVPIVQRSVAEIDADADIEVRSILRGTTLAEERRVWELTVHQNAQWEREGRML